MLLHFQCCANYSLYNVIMSLFFAPFFNLLFKTNIQFFFSFVEVFKKIDMDNSGFIELNFNQVLFVIFLFRVSSFASEHLLEMF